MKNLWVVEEKMPWGWVPDHRNVFRTRAGARELAKKWRLEDSDNRVRVKQYRRYPPLG